MCKKQKPEIYGFAALDGAPFPPFAKGEVWLVGAGPGAPGLLSLIGYHALQKCDAVVYDALVNPAIVKWARACALRIKAGKRGGKPSAQQKDISSKIIELAKQNKRVVRLKGGDPFLFGRGAEEAGALAAADIVFRIVPGIPAGIGGLAYAGIPATSKQINSSLLFMTAHDKNGKLPVKSDWKAIAKAGEVIVFYMALGKAKKVAEMLLAGGREKTEPVVFISKATLAEQKILPSTISDVAQGNFAKIAGPALMVVGHCAIWQEQLDWFSSVYMESPLG